MPPEEKKTLSVSNARQALEHAKNLVTDATKVTSIAEPDLLEIVNMLDLIELSLEELTLTEDTRGTDTQPFDYQDDVYPTFQQLRRLVIPLKNLRMKFESEKNESPTKGK